MVKKCLKSAFFEALLTGPGQDCRLSAAFGPGPDGIWLKVYFYTVKDALLQCKSYTFTQCKKVHFCPMVGHGYFWPKTTKIAVVSAIRCQKVSKSALFGWLSKSAFFWHLVAETTAILATFAFGKSASKVHFLASTKKCPKWALFEHFLMLGML